MQDTLLKKRIVQDFKSYIFFEEEGRYILEGSVNELIDANCKKFFDYWEVPIVGNKRYQEDMFQKLTQFANHFGGHTEKALEGLYLPTEPLIIGTEAFEKAMTEATSILYILDRIVEMVDEELREKFDI